MDDFQSAVSCGPDRTCPTVSNYNFSSLGTQILVRTVGRDSLPNLSGWVPAPSFTTGALLVFQIRRLTCAL